MVRLFGVYHAPRTLVLLAGEALFILLFSFTAIRLTWGGDGLAHLESLRSGLSAGLMVVVWCFSLYCFDLYPFPAALGWRLLARSLLQAGATAYVTLLLLGSLFSLFLGAPGAFGLATLLLAGLLFSERLIVSSLPRFSAPGKRCLFLGLDTLALDLAQEIRRRPELGIELVGYVSENGLPLLPADSLPCVGKLSDLESCIAGNRAGMAVVALRERRRRLPLEELLRLRFSGLKVLEAPTLYERITGKIPVDELSPSWLLFADGFRLHPWALKGQRLLSVLLAALGLLLVWPLLVAIAVALKLESPGPAVFRQERVGQLGRRFTLYKFRSMRDGAERATGPVWAREQDDRVTRVGRILRQSRLDELPQLWNVLRGDMNLVGPRPERPVFVEQLAAQIPFYDYRHRVRPGITGWAQVKYRYGATVEDQREKLRYDLFYIKNFSLWLDLYILFHTAKVVLRGSGAR